MLFNRRHRVFAHHLIPYILFLLLSLLLGWLIYQKTIKLVESEATASHRHLLEQSKEVLERRLEEIASITLQLAGDTRIMQFQSITNPFEGKNTYRILDTNKSLYDYTMSNNFVFKYYILFKNSNLVLAPGASYSFEHFFQTVARYGQKSANDWREDISNRFVNRKIVPVQDVTMNGTTFPMLTYLQSIGLPGNPQGAIMVMIDQREIQKLFQGLNQSEGGWAYLIDRDGQVISSLSGNRQQMPVDFNVLTGHQGVIQQPIDKQDMTITYTKSDYNGWTYVVGQPTAVVLGKVRYIQKIVFAFTFVFLLVGIFIAYMLAYRNSKPLRHIVELILEKTAMPHHRKDAFGLIGDTVNTLFHNKEKLEEEVERQMPLLKAALFQRLLTGQLVSERDSELLVHHFGRSLQGLSYYIVIVQLQGYEKGVDLSVPDDLDMKRLVLKEMLKTATDQDILFYDIVQHQFAVLFPFETAQKMTCQQSLGQWLQQVKTDTYSQLQLGAVYGIGGASDSLGGISRSYEQAREALGQLLWNNDQEIVWYEELATDMSTYYFPQDVEARLVNLAKAGDGAEVNRLLDDIYAENFHVRHLSLPVVQLLLNEIWGSLVKLLPQVELDQGMVYSQLGSLAADLHSADSLRKHYQSIRSTYQQVCASVNEHKKSQNVLLLESILAALQNSYTNSNLCLEMIADQFRISKVYLSQFFKEQTGTNFSDYLEKLRMDQAKSLLQTTHLTVNEISVQVGYSSLNTFCRAFKRLHGISATSFKEIAR